MNSMALARGKDHDCRRMITTTTMLIIMIQHDHDPLEVMIRVRTVLSMSDPDDTAPS